MKRLFRVGDKVSTPDGYGKVASVENNPEFSLSHGFIERTLLAVEIGGALRTFDSNDCFKMAQSDRGGNSLAVGDSVVYNRKFLQDTGMLTGDIPHDRGTIVSITPFGGGDRFLATIQWDMQGEGKTLTSNLTRADRVHVEAKTAQLADDEDLALLWSNADQYGDNTVSVSDAYTYGFNASPYANYADNPFTTSDLIEAWSRGWKDGDAWIASHPTERFVQRTSNKVAQADGMEYAYFERIEFGLKSEDADYIAQQGQNDTMVAEVLEQPYVRQQLDTITDEALVVELRTYGAWDAEELAVREDNEARLVWLAAWQIVEERDSREASLKRAQKEDCPTCEGKGCSDCMNDEDPREAHLKTSQVPSFEWEKPEYIEYFAGKGADAIADLLNNGFTVENIRMEDQGWLDGMKSPTADVTTPDGSQTFTLRWYDSPSGGHWMEKTTSGAWVAWSAEKNAQLSSYDLWKTTPPDVRDDCEDDSCQYHPDSPEFEDDSSCPYDFDRDACLADIKADMDADLVNDFRSAQCIDMSRVGNDMFVTVSDLSDGYWEWRVYPDSNPNNHLMDGFSTISAGDAFDQGAKWAKENPLAAKTATKKWFCKKCGETTVKADQTPALDGSWTATSIVCSKCGGRVSQKSAQWQERQWGDPDDGIGFGYPEPDICPFCGERGDDLIYWDGKTNIESCGSCGAEWNPSTMERVAQNNDPYPVPTKVAEMGWFQKDDGTFAFVWKCPSCGAVAHGWTDGHVYHCTDCGTEESVEEAFAKKQAAPSKSDPDFPDEEKKWNRAKEIVKEQKGKSEDDLSDRDWSLVTHIWKGMKKVPKAAQSIIECPYCSSWDVIAYPDDTYRCRECDNPFTIDDAREVTAAVYDADVTYLGYDIVITKNNIWSRFDGQVYDPSGNPVYSCFGIDEESVEGECLSFVDSAVGGTIYDPSGNSVGG